MIDVSLLALKSNVLRFFKPRNMPCRIDFNSFSFRNKSVNESAPSNARSSIVSILLFRKSLKIRIVGQFIEFYLKHALILTFFEDYLAAWKFRLLESLWSGCLVSTTQWRMKEYQAVFQSILALCSLQRFLGRCTLSDIELPWYKTPPSSNPTAS
jgi:hypothetical protein